MSFDRFFDFHDGMEEIDKIVAFSVGCVPTPLHLGYIDLNSFFNPATKGASSVGLACNLASGVTAAEVIKILLGRKPLRAAPWYSHFDAYRQKLVVRRLLCGNRHVWQRLKRWWLKRKFAKSAK
jgi:hypothetical protein